MNSHGSTHPLDVDLADLVDGLTDETRAAQLEAHLATCLLCRIKRHRLRGAPTATTTAKEGSLPAPAFVVPSVEERDDPAAGEIWLAGSEERALVVVLAVHEGRVLVAPASLNVQAADDEALVVDAQHSPLGVELVIHTQLGLEIPTTALAGRVGAFPSLNDLERPGVATGTTIEGPSDPRLELRQHLVDRLASMEEIPLDPATSADAPPTSASDVASALINDLRALRGRACAVRAMTDWDDVLLAHSNGWEPLAAIDEVGVVLVVLDTPHGLVDDRDFDAARSVLTRFNATALVVLASALSEFADVFDASSLNYGIDLPSGAHTSPRPLIGDLSPFDAIAKYLDQHTGARSMGLASRGPVTRVDVAALLREAAAAAVTDAVRQGSRFKITPKRRGYESLAGADDVLGAALGKAFNTDESVVEDLLNLARRTDG